MKARLHHKLVVSYLFLICLVVVMAYLFPDTPTITLLIGLLTILVLGYGVSRFISQPIRSMVEAVRAIADGQFTVRVHARSRDEIGELATAMNEMVEWLKAMFDRITEEKKQLEAVLAGMAEGVMVTDHRGRIVMTNQMFRHRFTDGRSPNGQLPIEVVRDPLLQETVDRLLRSSGSETLVFTTSSGETFSVHLAQVAAGDGKAGVVALFHDITDLKRLDRIRRDFVANVSHELRTPLTTIHGYAETLLDGALNDSEVAERFVRTIVKHSERLSRLTDDLLSLSQLESGQIDLNRRFIPLRPIVEQVIEGFDQSITNKNLTCPVDLPAILPPLFADEALLEQALTNLIDNAVKYTPEGGKITVTARHIRDRETGRQGDKETRRSEEEVRRDEWVEIAVTDTGIGIPQDALPRIFERFYRVDRSRSHDLGGTGLGLSIVKHIAEAHGGSVHVESMVGKGSTFTLRFPSVKVTP